MATLSLTELETALKGLDLATPVPHFDSADVLTKPLDLIRSYLADILSSLIDADRTAAYKSISLSNSSLHGDLTVVLPKLKPGCNAGELAADLIKKFPQCPLFGFPWADGVYLRICVTPQTLPRLLIPYIKDRKGDFGCDSSPGLRDSSAPTGDRKKVVVEFSSPNIASEFQGKHLKSTIIGAFVSNVYENMGWDVTRLNYFGDAKEMALLGVGWGKFGSEEAFQENPTAHLLDVYHKIREDFQPELAAAKKIRDEAKKKAQEEADDTAEIESKGLFAERNEFFKKMESGDEDTLALYTRIRDIAIANYTKLYARLGLTFDENSGESQVSQGTITEVEQALKDKEICKEKGGAWAIQMHDIGAKGGVAIIRDRAGSSTYLLRYLAAALERWRKFEFDKMAFVAADKTNHFPGMFKILEAIGMTELRERLLHVQFSDMSHMSEKLGQGQQPHDILDQCEKAMLDVLEADAPRASLLGTSSETAKLLATTGLIIQELSSKRAGDHAVDIDALTSFKPGTGPDLQYWYARLCSALKENLIVEDLSSEEYASLADEEQTSLLLLLSKYPDVTHEAYKGLESAPVVTYLRSVVEHLADCLDTEDDGAGEEGTETSEVENTETVDEGEASEGVGGREETVITPAQAALYEATRIVLENGMRLLGLTPIQLPQHDRADTPTAV